MPTKTHRFPTPEPIRLHLRSGRGAVEVLAGDADETVVEISTRHDEPNVRVEASSDGRSVTVHVPRHRRLANPPRVDITVRLPEGSTVDLSTASASITTRGRLADADVRTASGSISVEHVTGDADVKAASADVRLGAIGGSATLKSASGDLHVASVGGRCIAAAASGAIEVGWAGELVTAVTASGSITVRDVVRGSLTLKTSSGAVTVGVRKGTLVWLDLKTASGRTINNLTDDAGPAGDEEPLTLKVLTASGNITITPSAAGGATGPSGDARDDDRRESA